MSRNLTAGRAKLTAEERDAIDALLDGTPEGDDRAFHEQLTIARQKIAGTRQARRERGRDR